MEEIHSYSDTYRSSSSSASSPTSRVPSSSFFYLRKPGSLQRPKSFEDSPEWEDNEVDVRMAGGNAINNTATATASPTFSKLSSGSLASPTVQEPSSILRRASGAYIVWRDLAVSIKGKRKNKNCDRIVKSSNGYALPGTLTVILGPAKSGKLTL